MKRNLFRVAAVIFLLASCTKNQTQPEFTGKLIDIKQSLASQAVSSTATIDAGTVQQTIQGFGGASILAWEADLTSDQRTKAFSTSSGIGMSILRVMVPSTGTGSFAAEKPTIDAAKGFGAKVVATAWNAPSGMMTGVHLNTASYAAYASYISSYNTAVGGVYAI